MKHRLFLGIKISGHLLSNISSFKKTNQDMIIRWSIPENLHLTLVPPWYSENIESAMIAVSSVRDFPKAFPIRFTQILFGPDPQRPRLLWLAGESSPALEEVKWKLEKAIRIKPKYRAFVPHVTLGRFHERIDPVIRSRFPQQFLWEEPVQAITLFESYLSPKGANYTVRATFPLPENA